MKSKIFIGLFLILAFFLFGCAGEDVAEEEVEVEEEMEEAEEVVEEEVVGGVVDTGYLGSWKQMSSTYIDDSSHDFVNTSEIVSQLVLTSDTFEFTQPYFHETCTYSGTMEIIGNEMITTADNDECYSGAMEGIVTTYEYSVNGDELTLKLGSGGVVTDTSAYWEMFYTYQRI
tara:strand:+ start:225 stop:743 length:519 start_codon:yes stop_codon:yes gene_type:complete